MGGIFTKGAIARIMEGIEEKLRQLVTEACSYQVGNAQRQKNLTKIIRLISNKLWKENTPYYQDALTTNMGVFLSKHLRRKHR